MNVQHTRRPGPHTKHIHALGGSAALLTLLAVLVESAATFFPGRYASFETVIDWFTQLQNNPFMGLRNLGLMNIIMFSLGIPLYLALYIVHREKDNTLAALALITSLMGTAVFFATNRAFPMLELSARYAQATTESQRMMIEAAGQAMLSVGRSHSPGTFLGFFLGEIAGIAMSAVMLRGRIFGKTAALAGIVGFTLFAFFEVCVSFIPALGRAAMIIIMPGVMLNIVWLLLTGLGFLRLARSASGEHGS